MMTKIVPDLIKQISTGSGDKNCPYQPWDLICSSLGQDCTILSISPHANSEVRPYTTALELSQYLQTTGGRKEDTDQQEGKCKIFWNNFFGFL